MGVGVGGRGRGRLSSVPTRFRVQAPLMAAMSWASSLEMMGVKNSMAAPPTRLKRRMERTSPPSSSMHSSGSHLS